MKRIAGGVAVLALALAGCSSEPEPLEPWVAPDVVGLSLEDAAKIMSSAGVPMTRIRNENGDLVAATETGKVVVEQNQPAGATVNGAYPLGIDVADKAEAEAIQSSAAAESAAAAERAKLAGQITYRVTGPGSASITYFDGSGQISQQSEATLPWKRTVQNSGGYATMGFFSVSAQKMSEVGGISCEIFYEGVRVTSNTSSGAYSIVSCEYSTG